MRVATEGHLPTEMGQFIQIPHDHIISPSQAVASRERTPSIKQLVLILCVLAMGMGLRVYAYERNASLWNDEAMLALNIVERSPRELLQPLDYNQGAPVGYLLAVKLSTETLGIHERGLRFPSLFAAVLGFLLFGYWVFRTLPLRTAVTAFAIFALSPYLIAYAAEAKQYALDATIAIGLLMIAMVRYEQRSPMRHALVLGGSGAIAIWFSHPSIFVLAGIGTVWLWQCRSESGRRLPTLLMGGLWLASFAASYLVILRHLGTNNYLREFWASTFMPFPPRSLADIGWFVDSLFGMFKRPGGFNGLDLGLAGIAALAYILGCAKLYREQRILLLHLVLPIAFCLVASGLGRYPFAGRLILFTVPLLIVPVAVGILVIKDALSQWDPRAGVLAIGMLFLGLTLECRNLLKKPLHDEPIREVVDLLAKEFTDTDVIYVYSAAIPGYMYYLQRCSLTGQSILLGTEIRNGSPAQWHEEASRVSSRSVWVCMAHIRSGDEHRVRAAFSRHGAETIRYRSADAMLIRYGAIPDPKEIPSE